MSLTKSSVLVPHGVDVVRELSDTIMQDFSILLQKGQGLLGGHPDSSLIIEHALQFGDLAVEVVLGMVRRGLGTVALSSIFASSGHFFSFIQDLFKISNRQYAPR